MESDKGNIRFEPRFFVVRIAAGSTLHLDFHTGCARPRNLSGQVLIRSHRWTMFQADPIDTCRYNDRMLLCLVGVVVVVFHFVVAIYVEKGNVAGEGIQIFHESSQADLTPWIPVSFQQMHIRFELVGDLYTTV